ncbi:indole-3-glycerol phosphate synthase TrpC [Halalkalibacillus halophilus]|uniref:indole-3-glycerol phosphate synthase TrpC n=1 Tax=Halalkalibacillus halophilus TaxID=392827 RepID=UPI000401E3CE|nr:indole-3-glycerol phosphate synthase TrpC [Halalkalibacillus halophilus]
MSETILQKILEVKKLEVEKLSEESFDTQNRKNASKANQLYQSLKDPSYLSVIAEIKRASPSKGDINIHMDPAQQGKHYEDSGANAISVLTDHSFFKGSFDDLAIVSKTTNVPILCKDFIIDPIQIEKAKVSGANVILLIVAALPEAKLKMLYDTALKHDLEVIVEVHNEEELETALKINPDIIGINNRDLKTFETNLKTTATLIEHISNDHIAVISESGIQDQADARTVQQYGADGILVGESLMRSDSIPTAIHEMKHGNQESR